MGASSFRVVTRVLLFALLGCNADARGKAQHVVLIVWDGMRPEFATDKYAPHLAALPIARLNSGHSERSGHTESRSHRRASNVCEREAETESAGKDMRTAHRHFTGSPGP